MRRSEIVLLPGMDGTGDLFPPLVAALERESLTTRVVRYPTVDPLDYDALGALVRDVLPTEAPFVLLGESFSGPIAISLAARHPAGLRGLVLCGTFARNPRPGLAVLRPLLGMLPLGRPPIGLLCRLLFGRHATPALRAELARILAGISPAVSRTRLRAVLDVDVSARLAAIDVPALLLRARHDRVVPRAAGDLLARRLPRARVVELEGPHMLLQTAPDEAARILADFVREV